MSTAPDGSYWTLEFPPISDEARIAWQLGPKRKYAPHSWLAESFFPSVKALKAYYKAAWEKWTPPRSYQVTLVEPTEAGWNIVKFPTYAAAVSAGKARALLRKLAAKSAATEPNLKSCPFCRKSDLIEIIRWANERRDGTEYEAKAVRCNRCDCVVPLHVWQKGTEVKL